MKRFLNMIVWRGIPCRVVFAALLQCSFLSLHNNFKISVSLFFWCPCIMFVEQTIGRRLRPHTALTNNEDQTWDEMISQVLGITCFWKSNLRWVTGTNWRKYQEVALKDTIACKISNLLNISVKDVVAASHRAEKAMRKRKYLLLYRTGSLQGQQNHLTSTTWSMSVEDVGSF